MSSQVSLLGPAGFILEKMRNDNWYDESESIYGSKRRKHMPIKTLQSGIIVEIEGREYVVLEQKEDDKYLIMTAKNVRERVFQDHCTYRVKAETQVRPDGQPSNLYEGSRIDKYLERFWYSRLSLEMKTAIQETAIQQKAFDSSFVEQNDITARTIVRHVFLPGLDEIMNAMNLKDKDKFREFVNNENFWTRDRYVWKLYGCRVKGQQVLYLNSKKADIFASAVQFKCGVRPTFVIDLSKIDYDIV